MDGTVLRKRRQENQTAKQSSGGKQGRHHDGSHVLRNIFYAFVTTWLMVTIYFMFAFPWMFEYNNELQKGEKFYEDLAGAESFAVGKNGDIYTGLLNGSIIKITLDKNGRLGGKNSITHLVDVPSSEVKLTRPLGMEYRDGTLFFPDAYQGIFSLDLVSKKLTKIIGYDAVEPHMKFINDVEITSDASTLYFNDLSHRWTIGEIPNILLDPECTGRLFKFDFKTKHIQKLRDEICSANGILMSPDESKVLVAETVMSRVMVYDLKESKVSRFVTLPGAPDNIRPLKGGCYLVALPLASKLPMEKYLNYIPGARNIIIRAIQTFTRLNLNDVSRGTVAILDENFNVVRVLYDTDGRVAMAISEAIQLDNGDLIIGSFVAPGIVQIKHENLNSINPRQ